MEKDPPTNIIENYLSEVGSANIKYLAVLAHTTKKRVNYIVKCLVEEGKVRFYANEQEGGSPVAEWKGT